MRNLVPKANMGYEEGICSQTIGTQTDAVKETFIETTDGTSQKVSLHNQVCLKK